MLHKVNFNVIIIYNTKVKEKPKTFKIYQY